MLTPCFLLPHFSKTLSKHHPHSYRHRHLQYLHSLCPAKLHGLLKPQSSLVTFTQSIFTSFVPTLVCPGGFPRSCRANAQFTPHPTPPHATPCHPTALSSFAILSTVCGDNESTSPCPEASPTLNCWRWIHSQPLPETSRLCNEEHAGGGIVARLWD